MNWTKMLKSEVEATYHATEALVAMVERKRLAWKPSTGTNWMTTSQLLRHITDACGSCMKGFVTGDWGLPPDASMEDMLPPAGKMPVVKTVAEAKKLLAADKKLALAMIKKAGEKRLATTKVGAPWDPTPHLLGEQLSHMVNHLRHHKAQLFYYLKLQGKPVHTGNLYGM